MACYDDHGTLTGFLPIYASDLQAINTKVDGLLRSRWSYELKPNAYNLNQGNYKAVYQHVAQKVMLE